MRTNTKARQPEAACPFPVFLAALDNPAPSFASPPRTLRDHIGKREFGDFGTVLMANRPPATDLTDRVAKWRAIEAAKQHGLPLHTNLDHAAEDRRFNLLFVVTPTAIMVWVLVGLMAAWLKGVI
jgi:hypothetical protein